MTARPIQDEFNAKAVKSAWSNIDWYAPNTDADGPSAGVFVAATPSNAKRTAEPVPLEWNGGTSPSTAQPILLCDHNLLSQAFGLRSSRANATRQHCDSLAGRTLPLEPGRDGQTGLYQFVWDDAFVGAVLQTLSFRNSWSATAASANAPDDVADVSDTQSLEQSDDDEPYHPGHIGLDGASSDDCEANASFVASEAEQPAADRPISVKAVFSEAALLYLLQLDNDTVGREPLAGVKLFIVNRVVRGGVDGAETVVVPHFHAAVDTATLEAADCEMGSLPVRLAHESSLLQRLHKALAPPNSRNQTQSSSDTQLPQSYEYNVWRIGQVDVLVRCPQSVVVTDVADVQHPLPLMSAVAVKPEALHPETGQLETISRREVLLCVLALVL